jgi:hypothetical protein
MSLLAVSLVVDGDPASLAAARAQTGVRAEVVVPAAVARPGEVAVRVPKTATTAERRAALWARATAPLVVWFVAGAISTPTRAREQAEALEQTGAAVCFTRSPMADAPSGAVVRITPQQAFGGPCWLEGLAVRRASVGPFSMPDAAVRGFGTVMAALLACVSPPVLVDRCLAEPDPSWAASRTREQLLAGQLQDRLVALEAVAAIGRDTPYDGPHRGAVQAALLAATVRHATAWTVARNQSLKGSGRPSWASD